jgi:hypothetical protein
LSKNKKNQAFGKKQPHFIITLGYGENLKSTLNLFQKFFELNSVLLFLGVIAAKRGRKISSL